MPRRRRKKSDARRPPLVFTESPVNVVHKLPSPAYCSDHPPTADVVNIDPDASFPWVSPQFPTVPNSHGRARQARRRVRSPAGPATRARHRSGRNTTTSSFNQGRSQHHKKYGPLKFVGDRSPSPPSPVEDLDFEEEAETTVIPKLKNTRRKSSNKNKYHSKENREISLQGNDSIAEDEDNNGESPAIHQKCDGANASHKRAAQRKKSSAKTVNTSVSDGDSVEHIETAHKRAELENTTGNIRHELQNKNSCGSNHREMDTSSLTHFTQKRAVSGQRHKRPKRLFTDCDMINQDCSEKDANNVDTHVENRTLSTDDRTAMSDTSFNIDHAIDIVTPQGKFTYDKNDENFDPQQLGSVFTPDNRRQSLRLQHQHVFSPLLNTTQMPHGTPLNILVYDTPESEYGVSVRLRRQRKHKLNGAKHTEIYCQL